MKSRLKVYVPLLLMNFVFVTALSGVAYANDEYDYLSDQLSREHRDGADVDEWIERGTATITASPRFEDGTRLTAWASKHEGDDSYEFAIASAVYFFEIPAQAQYIEILVRYRGEPSESYFEDAEPIAGRVWIRNLQREATRSYEDKSAEETRYGDTFVLRAKRRSETIKVAAAGHTDEEGLLEMHVVAEDGQQIDIEYINVSTYRKQHDIRVFPRYARHHHWRPWHRYTYSYFYDGPFYYGTDLGYYFRWTYPVYDRSYLSIRSAYGNYVHRYYTVHHRPYYYYRSYPSRTNIHVHVNNRQARSTQLNRWSGEHETARREYTRSRSSTTARSNNRGNVRSRVNAIVQQHRQEQSTLTEQRQNSDVVRSRDRSSTNTRLNTTVHQRSRASSPYRRSFTQPNRSSQSPMQRRRYQPYSRSDGNGYNRTARTNRTPTSNAERRQRLSERSRSSYSRQYRAPSSNRQFGSRTSAERQHSANSSTSRSRSNANRSRSSVSRQRSSTSSRTSSSSRSRPPSTVRQRSSSSPSRSSSSSSSSSEDDDEKKSRSRQRQRSRSR